MHKILTVPFNLIKIAQSNYYIVRQMRITIFYFKLEEKVVRHQQPDDKLITFNFVALRSKHFIIFPRLENFFTEFIPRTDSFK